LICNGLGAAGIIRSMKASIRSKSTEARFDALYTDAFDDVLRFVYRRVGPVDTLARAENITQETFTTAWRRLASVPEDAGEARAWLYTVARSLLLREQRGNQRRIALAIKLADDAVVSVNRSGHDAITSDPHEVVAARLDLAAVWATLRPAEQEVLSLAAWEDLPAAQAARVLGISAMAYRTRLTRARAVLRQALAAANSESGARVPPLSSHPAHPAHPPRPQQAANLAQPSHRRSGQEHAEHIPSAHISHISHISHTSQE